jgi:hypothetical protein
MLGVQAFPTVAVDPNQSSGSKTNTLKINSSGDDPSAMAIL